MTFVTRKTETPKTEEGKLDFILQELLRLEINGDDVDELELIAFRTVNNICARYDFDVDERQIKLLDSKLHNDLLIGIIDEHENYDLVYITTKGKAFLSEGGYSKILIEKLAAQEKNELEKKVAKSNLWGNWIAISISIGSLIIAIIALIK